MKILTASDQSNLPGLAALLKSLELNASRDENQEIEITIVSTGINATEKERLEACCSYRIQWKEFQSIGGLISQRGCQLTYVKLEPENYTTAQDRLIWLDSDAIVLGELAPLWNINLEGMPLAAAQDPCGNPHINFKNKNSYLNAGVLVYDMKIWLKEKLSTKLVEDAKENLWVDYDQGAFNSVLAGRWKELDIRWNNCDPEDMSTKVMHFMSQPKPWEGRVKSELWWQIFDQTPFKNELKKMSNHPKVVSKSPLASKLEAWGKEPWLRFQSYLKRRRRIKETSQNKPELPSPTSTTARSSEPVE
jgi:lipopolysaccharide biosynthesis glycosyltransferase